MKLRARTVVLTATGFVLLALGGAGMIYLRTDRFQAAVRAVLTERIRKATGLLVTMDQMSLDILWGRFSVTRLVLNSPKGLSLSVEEATGSFRLATLWRPKIELGALNLTRLHMTIRPQPGGAPWNMEPVIRTSLAVAARQAVVKDSWVEYDNRRIPLDLVLESLNCDIAYQPDPQRYEVQVSYRNSPLRWLGRNFVYDLDAHLRVLPTGLDIVEFKMRQNKSRFTGSGSLRPWKSPVLQVRTKGSLDGEDAFLLTPALQDARGGVNAIMDVRVNGREYYLGGSFEGESVSFRTSAAHSLTGRFDVQNDLLRLKDVRGRVGDGEFRLEGDIQLRASNRPPNHIKVVASNVAIRHGSGLMDLHNLMLENPVDADVVLEWRHGQDDFSAEGTVDLHGIPGALPGDESRTALQGRTDFYYRKSAWYVKRASLASPSTALEVAGLDKIRHKVNLTTSRPAELFRMLRGFSSTLEEIFSQRPDWMAITGRYHLDGEFRLQLPDAVAYSGLASVERGTWRSYRVDSVSGMAEWDMSRFQLHGMKAQRGSQSAQGDFWIDSRLGGEYTDLYFDGSLHQVSLPGLAEFGVEWEPGTAGILTSPHMQAFYEKGVWRGEGRFEIRAGQWSGQPFDALRATVRIQDQKIGIVDGQIQRGSALVRADGAFDMKTRQMNFKAGLKELPLAEIPATQARNLPVDGRVTAAGEISGTPDDLSAVGNVTIAGLRYDGWDLGNGTAHLDLQHKSLAISQIDFRSDLGAFQGEMRIGMEPGYPGRATLRFSDWNVKKIIADSAPQIFSDLSTRLFGSLVLEGPFDDTSKLVYHDGMMNGARFTINRREFRNDGEIRFHGDARRVIIEKATLVGDKTNLSFEKNGVISFGADDPLDLRVTGKLDLGVADHLADFPKLGVLGAATVNVNVTGTRRSPQVVGTTALEAARIEYADSGFPLSDLNGNMIFSREAIFLKNVTGKVSSGSIQINGSASIEKGRLSKINLQGLLQKARLRYPKDFVSTIDAEMHLNGGFDALVLSGDVSVLRAEYLRDFSLLEQIFGGSSGGGGAQVSDSPFANISLNIPVHSREDGLYIDNELTRVRAGMNLTLRGTIAEPYVTGRVTASEGSIFFRGNRFDIVTGAVDFLDRNRINPILNVRAEADVRSYRVRLDIVGDLEHLHSHGLTVSSDPPLSQVDILALLIMGKSGDTGTTGVENPRRQAEMTGLSAASILAEEMTGEVGRRVERIFGLSTFRVDPFLAGATSDPTARLTISQRLAGNVQITFSRNLSTSQEQIVVIEYDVNSNLSIIATRDENGKYGIDFRFRKRIR
jgi:hypothetical protein